MNHFRFSPMTNGNMSAAHDAEGSYSCAFFQSSNTRSVIICLDTMMMVSIFLILVSGFLTAVLFRVLLAAILICLVTVLAYNHIKPKEQAY